jgi:mono/diheme cytochrome c family protein
MRLALLLFTMACSGAALAQGKALHDAACLQCHASLGGGDANHLYLRDDRKVKSLDGLNKRVAYCAKAADVDWNKQQKQAVVEYLRQRFYKF